MTENLFWRFSFSNFCIISYRLTFVKNFFNFFWNFIFSSCSVLTVSNFYILSQIQVLVKNFFKFFWKTFWTSFFRSSVLFLLATFTSYHRWSCLSRTFLFFLKNFFKFLSSSSATSDIIPYTYPLVNNFFYFSTYFFKLSKYSVKSL